MWSHLGINRFNFATFLYLAEARTWILNVIRRGLFLCSMIWGEWWLFNLLILVDWNCWPSLFKFVPFTFIKTCTYVSCRQVSTSDSEFFLKKKLHRLESNTADWQMKESMPLANFWTRGISIVIYLTIQTLTTYNW